MKGLPLYNVGFRQLQQEFADTIRAQGYSEGREPIYPIMIREFLFFLESRGIASIEEAKAKDIIAYKDYLRERPNQRREGGLSDSVLKHQDYSLRLFFDYLMETGQIQSSPAHLPKFSILKYGERQPISIEEVNLLYKACRSKIDKALLGLAYGCGLRRKEIERLNINDIFLSQGMLTVRAGKYGKSRSIPLSDNIVRDFKEYVIYERAPLLQYYNSDCRAFMVNRFGGRLMGQDMHTRLKRLVKATGNKQLIAKGVCLHCLRHSIATHLLDNGADIEFVQAFLGHEELNTTHHYSKKRKQRLMIRSAFEQYDKERATRQANDGQL